MFAQRPSPVMPGAKKATFEECAAGLLGITIEEIGGIRHFDMRVESNIVMDVHSKLIARGVASSIRWCFGRRLIRVYSPEGVVKFVDIQHDMQANHRLCEMN